MAQSSFPSALPHSPLDLERGVLPPGEDVHPRRLSSDGHQAFSKLRYPHQEIKKQINRARHVPRSLLLQDRPKRETNRTPLAITYSPQLKPLQRIISDLQAILDNDPSLSQTCGGRPVLATDNLPTLSIFSPATTHRTITTLTQEPTHATNLDANSAHISTPATPSQDLTRSATTSPAHSPACPPMLYMPSYASNAPLLCTLAKLSRNLNLPHPS
ncbi:uncharacterized protein LOC128830473 [Malaclemys terrapin pileata]|uniref:uncharacterized protein LOC128830473 n=1 Tax=Malaclemys terrapin pileata TaxID=2991368 RepID=UPI0023A823EC|nr:uncharacterized protein LOC128830473 [Malaclemys terrapin pileata]